MGYRVLRDNFGKNSHCFCFWTVKLASLDEGNDPPVFLPSSHLFFHLSLLFFLSSGFCFSCFHSVVFSQKALLCFLPIKISVSVVGVIIFSLCIAFFFFSFSFLGSVKLSNFILKEQFSFPNLCFGNTILSLTH